MDADSDKTMRELLLEQPPPYNPIPKPSTRHFVPSMNANNNKRSNAALLGKSSNMPMESGRESKKVKKAPIVVNLISDDEGSKDVEIRPTKFKVDYGDRVVDMNTERKTQKTDTKRKIKTTDPKQKIKKLRGVNWAEYDYGLSGEEKSNSDEGNIRQMGSTTKRALKERLLAAQREEKLLDDQLKAQTARHEQFDDSNTVYSRNIHRISSDEDEEYFSSKPFKRAPRQTDRTANGSAFDLAPNQDPAMPFDMSPFTDDPSNQSNVNQDRPGPPKPTAPKAKKAKIEPELCEEQRNLVNLILSRRNVFYTGSAGCGKSTVLKAFVQELKAQGRKVVIVAPTGKAALEVNGCTFWTFAGWTPGHFKKPLKKLKEGAHGKFVRKKMNDVDVLVIDEISMMENT